MPSRQLVAYIRQSRARDTDYSFELQEDEIRRYCARHFKGAEILWLREKASARTGSKRAEFARLMRLVKAQAVDTILCYKMNRLGRSVAALGRLLEAAVTAGIRVVSVTEGVDTATATGRFVAQMLTSVAELENEQRSEFIIGAKQQAKEEGRWLGGIVPYGYRRLGKGEMKAVSAEARQVRRAFELYAKGHSLRAIADKLRHPRWRIQYWLHNAVYGGTASFPAIVPPETFRMVQALHASNRGKANTGAHGEVFLLSGLVWCSHCGRRMTTETSTRRANNKTYRYYRYVCQTRKRGDECRSIQPRLSQSLLENRVIDNVKRYLKGTRAMDLRRRARHQERPDEAELAKRLQANQEAARRLVALLASPEYESFGDELKAQLDELAAERVELERQRGSRPAGQIEPEVYDAILQRFEYWDDLSHAERKRILSLLIERVEWDGKKISVAYR